MEVEAMPLLAKLGVCELTVAALSGWLMLATVERPEALRRRGVLHLGRIRQSHLDLLFMGTILTAVGIAVDPIPAWVGALLVLGAFVQPLMFLPLAFNSGLARASPPTASSTLLSSSVSALAGWDWPPPPYRDEVRALGVREDQAGKSRGTSKYLLPATAALIVRRAGIERWVGD